MSNNHPCHLYIGYMGFPEGGGGGGITVLKIEITVSNGIRLGSLSFLDFLLLKNLFAELLGFIKRQQFPRSGAIATCPT